MSDLFVPKNHAAFVKTQYDEVPAFSKLNPQDYFRGELPQLGRGDGVKVCLIDSGVADHACLKNVVNGANLGPSEHASDFTGHAHVVSGIVGANDPGALVGLAPDVLLTFAKASDDGGSASPPSVAAALVWAVVTGCHIAVVSYVPTFEDESLLLAVRKAFDSNVLVVMDGTAEGAVLPPGVVSTAGMLSPANPIISTFIDEGFVGVDAADFSPAVVGGVAALLIERSHQVSKKGKASVMAKHLMKLLRG